MPKITARTFYQAKNKRKLGSFRNELDPRATKKQMKELIATQRKRIAELEVQLSMKEKSNAEEKERTTPSVAE